MLSQPCSFAANPVSIFVSIGYGPVIPSYDIPNSLVPVLVDLSDSVIPCLLQLWQGSIIFFPSSLIKSISTPLFKLSLVESSLAHSSLIRSSLDQLSLAGCFCRLLADRPYGHRSRVTMEWLFGKRVTPEEMLRKNQRALNRAVRDLDRERARMEQQEKKVISDIKKLAKDGQMVMPE